MTAAEADVPVVVTGKRVIAADVVELELAAVGGAQLPAWRPGAHIDLLLAPGLERQYSLVGTREGRWLVAVFRERAGRGGSAHVHDELAVGVTLRARVPRNHFAFVPDAPAVFIAGGIGITPLLPMIAAAEEAGVDWSLHYAGRTHAGMAFADELVARHPDRVTLYAGDAGTRLDVAALLAVPSDANVYCCGPARLMDAVTAAIAAAGWPQGALHLERFEPKGHGGVEVDEEFEVELELSGITLTVPPGTSILETAEEAGAFVLSSCREGTCGTCETRIAAGEADHRDSVLSPEEQAENRTMMICVSRAAPGCPRLVLEL
jgi:ferredoxin-NADP reductase